MASDPNTLYATVAQIAATFVSILGGFLLTLGLARAAEKGRHERSLDRNGQVHEVIAKEDEVYSEKERQAEKQHREALLSIRLRYLRGQLDQRQEASEQIAANDRLISLREQRVTQLEDQLQRLHIAKRDAEDLVDRIEVEIFQLKILGVGFVLLLLLGVVGVGIPLYILPIDSQEESSLLGWIAQRGTIVLLGCLIIYVFAVFVMAGNKPYFDSKREQITNLLLLIALAIWFLWPYSGGYWPLTVGGWLLNIQLTVLLVLRLRSRRSLSPSEGRTDGLRIRHKKRTNLLR